MRSYLIALAATAITSVAAQNSYGSPTPTTEAPVYVTETISECETAPPETMITITNGVTVTYCPDCDKVPHTTIYTTVYQALCTDKPEWSLTPTTYTVTESCNGPEPNYPWTAGPRDGHIPPGFTVTTGYCGACATPGPFTLTQPCGCRATEGTSYGPMPTATTMPTGSSPAGGNRYGGNSVAPYPTQTGVSNDGSSGKCPGPNCRLGPSAGLTAPKNGTAPGLRPFKGGASEVGVAASAVLAVAIAGLAFVL